MKNKRPSTSPGALDRSPFDDYPVRQTSRANQYLIQYPGTSSKLLVRSRSATPLRPATAHPTGARPTSSGGTFPRVRPGTSASRAQRPVMPWELAQPSPEPLPFDEHTFPSDEQLEHASRELVVNETGVRLAFGSLWQHQKTIVIFIRHFLCPLCQDYVYSISRNYNPEVLRRDGLKLVIVSNGHHDFIKSYRKIFKTPFDVYTDAVGEVYKALGMTRHSLEKGPRQNYVRHGTMRGIGMVVSNAVKSGMPIWKNGGEITQLGGEFVLGPGIRCHFAHRMPYTRAHLPIHEVVEAAKIVHPEVTMLPDILVIERNHIFNASRTSVLDVFQQDYRDPEDDDHAFIRRRASTKRSYVPRRVNSRATWALPSTRRSWIIEEDRENEPSDTGHGKGKGNASDPEVMTLESREDEAVATSGTDSTEDSDTEAETDHEIKKEEGSTKGGDDTITLHSIDIITPDAPFDWRSVQRGTVQWRRARSEDVSDAVRTDDGLHDLAVFMGRGSVGATQSIPSDVDSTSSDGSTASEGRVCQAFVLKLLPALDLDTSLKFDEFDWLSPSPARSRRSSLQLNRSTGKPEGSPSVCSSSEACSRLSRQCS
ncbi:hypothetical protein V5O48_010364 [Marasmius crinis-equi]|uniref:Uncharacterized protein n=1 Tax=Marasmius crinis-equi TaxID=585013 RepID=A0ABR3F8M8_9AGAR